MHGKRICALPAILCLVAFLLPGAAGAQVADPDRIEVPIGAGGREYKDTLGRRRIETELIYLSPDADETLPRETASKPPERSEFSAELPRYALIAVMIALLAALAVFAVRFAPKPTVSMSSPQNSRRRSGARNTGGDIAPDAPVDATTSNEFLKQLQAMADRRAALILLSKRCLERAVAINGMALGRSQTAREILRKLPRNWDHHEALSRIIGFEERVQFGGHDLPEPVFQESLHLARPLFGLEQAR